MSFWLGVFRAIRCISNSSARGKSWSGKRLDLDQGFFISNIILKEMGLIHSAIEDVIAYLAAGKLAILTDHKDREDEGDLIACASTIIPEHINFMAKYGRGLICLAMSASEIDRLGLPPMAAENQCPHQTAFTVSIDAREGTTTGISAYDRAHTIRLAADPSSTISDFRMPGHMFPLRARQGGIFEREGHTEASVELCRLAGRGESAVICEIMDDDGHMMRKAALQAFVKTHSLKICSIASLGSRLIKATI